MDLRVGRCVPLLLSLGLLVLALAAPTAQGQVQPNGWGFGISDPDHIPGRSLDQLFSRLEPKTFRFIVPWNVVDDPGLMQQTSERISIARAAGVQEIAVSFGRPTTTQPPDRQTWLAKVSAFINQTNQSSQQVKWWSPANEPNQSGPDAPKLDVTRLVEYSRDLAWWLAIYRQADRMLSPDFADTAPFGTYIQQYRDAGGPFGEAIAWHPYNGVQNQSLSTTTQLLSVVPAGPPIWITEVGVHEDDWYLRGQTEEQQRTGVQWLIDVLAAQQRVWRISYYHMRDVNLKPPDPVPPNVRWWDSALVRENGTPRPAWYSWCTAAHGKNPQDPQCGGPIDDRYVATSCAQGGGKAATIGVFRRSTGEWLLRNSNTAGDAHIRFAYGGPWSPYLDVPVACDWDGNGTATVGVFRRSTGEWLLRNSNSPGDPEIRFAYGGPSSPYLDVPVAGDWDGNGTATVGVFRRSTGQWLLRNTNAAGNPDVAFAYGGPSSSPYLDVPVVGDWDGNGTTTVGVFRRSTGEWLLRNTNTPGNPDIRFAFGGPWEPYGDVPVVGDWDGNRTTTVGVFRRWTGAWLLRNANAGGAPDLEVPFGAAWAPYDDVPVAGDWNGQP